MTKLKKRSFDIKGGYNPEGLRNEIKEASVLDAIYEKAQNGLDWHSLEVQIKIDLVKDWVEFFDQGEGMSAQQLENYFVIKKSEAAKHEDARGCNGLASKFVFNFGTRETIRTCTGTDDPVLEVSYTYDDLEKGVFGNLKFHVEETDRLPEEPKTGSFSRFIITGIFPACKKYLEVEFLRKQLTKRFQLKQVDRVFINGKPLYPREIIGEKIVWTRESQQLGLVTASLYVPAKMASEHDLNIGTHGPVQYRREFLESLPPDLNARVPAIFKHHKLCGEIDVPGFKKWRTPNSKSFRSELFHSHEIDVFITMLRVLEVEAKKILDITINKVDRDIQKRFEIIASRLSKAFPVPESLSLDKERPKKKVTAEASIKRIHLEVGDSKEISLDNPDVDWHWDAKKSGGSLDKNTGDQIVFTAGDLPGVFELRYFENNNPLNTGIIQIKIVAKEKNFLITPAYVNVRPGAQVKFKVKNTGRVKGKIVWEGQNSGGKISGRDQEITYTAGKTSGTFLIAAYDSANPELKAEAAVSISSEKDISKPTKDSKPERIIHMVEETPYILITAQWGPEENLFVQFYKEDGIDVISLNQDHPFYLEMAGRKDDSFNFQIQNELIWRHVMRDERLSAAEVFERVGEIQKKISLANQEK